MRKTVSTILVSLTLLVVFSATSFAQDRFFVTQFSAGSVEEVFFGPNFSMTRVPGLSLPEDLVCDLANNRLIVAEPNANTLTAFDLAAFAPTPFVGAVAGNEGLSLDSAGNLFFNTRSGTGAFVIPGGIVGNAAALVIPPFSAFGEGTAIGLTGLSAGGLLAVDRTPGARVVISNPPFAPIFDLIPPGPFISPIGVTVNTIGDVFVSDSSSGSIQQFTNAGAFIGFFGPGLTSPFFIEFDSAGNLIVADFGAGLVHQINPAGAIINTVAVPGAVGVAVCKTITLVIDIKFLSLNDASANSFNCKSRGKLPVTILGSATFDVTAIDVSTLRLEEGGVVVSGPPVDSKVADRGSPADVDMELIAGTPDGFPDLDVGFDSQTIVGGALCSVCPTERQHGDA